MGAPISTLDIDIGECFTHFRCAADGTISVGYFDEGVFSGSPISSSGMARLADKLGLGELGPSDLGRCGADFRPAVEFARPRAYALRP